MTFLSYDGTYEEIDKILMFIQQFDATFGGKEFDKGSKLHHVAMSLTRYGKKW